jgi:uncharacterized protein YceK
MDTQEIPKTQIHIRSISISIMIHVPSGCAAVFSVTGQSAGKNNNQ